MLLSLSVSGLLSLSAAFLTGCEQTIPQEQKDWENTTEYFNSKDEVSSTTYYKPSAGSVGDPLPFYDPVEKEYKILYLHNFEQNMEQTFHPLWGVRTTDCATYTQMGEVLPTGRAGEQDAALGTGCIVYDEQENLLTIVLDNAAEGEETDPAQAFLGSWNIGPLTTLDIFEDGTGKFQLNGTRYSVTWRLEGQTLQMQQNGKGGVSAVRSGENLEVNIGGQVFLFHR